MNGIFLCVFALFSVPSVSALTCYNCAPDGVTEFCKDPKNTTVCSTPFDTCVKAHVEAERGDSKVALNYMQCGVEAQCDNAKTVFCDTVKTGLKPLGITVEECDYSCCQEDKCNGGSAIVASFIITITGVAVLLSGVFTN